MTRIRRTATIVDYLNVYLSICVHNLISFQYPVNVMRNVVCTTIKGTCHYIIVNSEVYSVLYSAANTCL